MTKLHRVPTRSTHAAPPPSGLPVPEMGPGASRLTAAFCCDCFRASRLNQHGACFHCGSLAIAPLKVFERPEPEVEPALLNLNFETGDMA